MREERCTVCGRGGPFLRAVSGNEHTLAFPQDVCGTCARTLMLAVDGIIEMLRDAHGENRERFLSKLMDRMASQGFPTGALSRRRTA